jgi:hypothetical protein
MNVSKFLPLCWESLRDGIAKGEWVINFKHLISGCCAHTPILGQPCFNYKLCENIAAIPDTSIRTRYPIHDRIEVVVEVFHNDSLKLVIAANSI